MAKDTLPVNAGRDDVEAFLKNRYSGTDFEVNKEHVDQVMQSLEQQRAWRASLDPQSQFTIAGQPGIAAELDPDNPPPGVTVVDRGKARNQDGS